MVIFGIKIHDPIFFFTKANIQIQHEIKTDPKRRGRLPSLYPTFSCDEEKLKRKILLCLFLYVLTFFLAT